MWVLGKNHKERIMTASYNDPLASDFSRYVRDGIKRKTESPLIMDHQDIFPDCKIKHGHSSHEKWALEGQFFNYKGVGIGGSATGAGNTIGIIDDPHKNAEEAFSALAKDKVWNWNTGTWRSRKEMKWLEIICMTLWAPDDLCGRTLEDPLKKDKWFVFKLPASKPRDEDLRWYHKGLYENKDKMLFPEQLDREGYLDAQQDTHPAIFSANYDQDPVSIEGRLYKYFKTYSEKQVPEKYEEIIAYIDTADTGDDYLCVPVAGFLHGQLYAIDNLTTQDGMEITEPAVATLLHNNNVNTALFESNNGGRGFARNVERLLWERHGNRSVSIRWFHQTKNKIARILAGSTYIMNHVHMPEEWHKIWPSYYRMMKNYQSKGKNAFDDPQDATTGLYEMVEHKIRKPKSEKAVTMKKHGFF